MLSVSLLLFATVSVSTDDSVDSVIMSVLSSVGAGGVFSRKMLSVGRMKWLVSSVLP